jgi:hypothetical protein
MKNPFVIFCLLGILFVNCIFAQNAEPNNQGFNSEIHGELYIEGNAGFSMYMPKGWETRDMNQKYLMIMGPVDNNYTPNISFGDEQYSGPISEYVDALIALLAQFYADFEVPENVNFKTYSGLQGRCLTILGRINEIHARQKLYLVQNRNRTTIMVITGTALAVSGKKYDALFNECVKTLNWIQ